MTLVAGVDSSTQSCKVVIRDAETGALVRSGRAAHPDGTEVHPHAWWDALSTAIAEAGGLDDVAAVSVGAQQHGMVCLDESGEVVRPALLWNDTRSARAANDLIAELGGPPAWADAVGSVPVASFTVTKLRWLAEHEPDAARRTAAVCLPHDWLTWRLGGAAGLAALTTDRGDASGTGYWSPATDGYRPDLLELAFGRLPVVPAVLGPDGSGAADPGRRPARRRHRRQRGRRARASGPAPGDVIVSIGTSGTVFSVVGDAGGRRDGHGGRVRRRDRPLPAAGGHAQRGPGPRRGRGDPARVDHDELAELALSAPAGADGLVLVPYLEGERTPNRPHATGALHGLRLANATPGPPGPGRGRGPAVRAGRRTRRAGGPGHRGRAGHPRRRRRPLGGGAPDRAGRLRRPGASCRRRGSTSPTARPARRRGSRSGGAEPPQWTVDGHRGVRGRPDAAGPSRLRARRGTWSSTARADPRPAGAGRRRLD